MSANLRLGREIMRENMNRANRMAYMRNHPVEWEPGGRERLIEEAIAQGKVTRCEPSAASEPTKWTFGIVPTTLMAARPNRANGAI
jgi:hypothetical protein